MMLTPPRALTLQYAPIAAAAALLVASGAPAQDSAAQPPATPAPAARGEAGMLRYPDVSAEHIVFVYANDLWLVPREGGVAMPLASPEGAERDPRFSPDGQTVAFSGNYEGDSDLYTIPVQGGIPFRVTHHPGGDRFSGWAPDGRLIFSTSAFSGQRRAPRMYTVSSTGGLPTEVSVPYGLNGTLHADGKTLAYTPNARDGRNWKRYVGGTASDVWLFDLEAKTSRRVTDWEGTDSFPMWHGDDLYYVSDRGPAHRLNVWKFDRASGDHTQVSKLTDFDVKWPAIGPGPEGQGEVVFQSNAGLFLLDLATEEITEVPVTIPGARETERASVVNVGDSISEAGISSTGKRAVVEARGDIWTLPAKEGKARNLTATGGIAERDPAWSPDGRWIAYFSDQSGEYQLTVSQSDGRGETRQLVGLADGFKYAPTWSPDSKKIAYSDRSGSIYLADLESGETRRIGEQEGVEWGVRVNWSPDSRWIAFTNIGEKSMMDAVMLYDSEEDELHKVTGHMFNSQSPTFDRKGDFLYLTSARNFSGQEGSAIDSNYIHTDAEVLLAVPLREDVEFPWTPKSDEETWDDEEEEEEEEGDASEADDEDTDSDQGAQDPDEDAPEEAGEEKSSDEDSDEEAVEPVEIDLEGFEARAMQLPLDPGNFGQLAVNHAGHLIYVRRGEGIKLYDIHGDDQEEKDVSDGGSFALSADGKMLLTGGGRKPAIGKAEEGSKPEEVKRSGMETSIDPREEWPQVYRDSWRFFRDYFYAANMHGVDWEAVYAQYRPMIDYCVTREDVDYVMRETVAELNVGHAYVRGGPMERGPRRPVGLLGADFALENGAYRIVNIVEGGVWDSDARGPLSMPGVDVSEGDYLLAVDGEPVDVTLDPWAAFVGKAGEVCELTVSSEPTLDDDARRVMVKTLRSEGGLRYREWIESNRAMVEKLSGGRVGYVYVPDTGGRGRNDFFRQLYGQVHLDALIIDERWNGGGQFPNREIEALDRPRTNYWGRRWGRSMATPGDSHQGPKCMLINRDAGSGGDMFPYLFRKAGIGKLIGTRTWGGLVGYSGSPQLIDGGTLAVPSFGFFELDGSWGVEGHGVAPDIEVLDDPALMQGGADPQIERAVAEMLKELETGAYSAPTRPADPVRTGMGLPEEER